MKTQLLSLLAGTALIATVSVAQASEPMVLSENQMDQVSAGADITVTSPGNFFFTVQGVVFTLIGPNTIKIPLPS